MECGATLIALRRLSRDDGSVERRQYRGFIVEDVQVGRPVVLLSGSVLYLETSPDHRLLQAALCVVTSPVQRVLQAVGDSRRFVATQNSVYVIQQL